MSIHSRLKLGFTLVIAFFLIQSAITFFYVSRSNHLVDTAVNRNFFQSQFISQLASDGNKLRRYEKEYFIYVDNPRKRAAYYTDWSQAKSAISDRLNEAIHDRGHTWAGDRATLRQWKGSLDAYDDGFHLVKQMVLDGAVTNTRTANSEIRQAKNEFRSFLEGTDGLGKEKLAQSTRIAGQIEANFDLLYKFIFVTSAAGILLLMALLQFVPRSISRPVKELTDAATLMSKGDLNKRIEPSEIQEFRSLSETLERMRVSQKALIERMLARA